MLVPGWGCVRCKEPLRDAGSLPPPQHESYVVLSQEEKQQNQKQTREAFTQPTTVHDQQRTLENLRYLAEKCKHVPSGVPLCNECANTLLAQMQKRLHDAHTERELLQQSFAELYLSDDFAVDAQSEAEMERDFQAECAANTEEEAKLRAAITSARREKEALVREAARLRGVREAQLQEEEEIHAQLNALEIERQRDCDEELRMAQLVDFYTSELRRLESIDVFVDVFEIGTDSTFGTINGLRLGRLPGIAIEWAEINAALGQVALFLQSLSRWYGHKFANHEIVPMGSFSKIYARDDPRNVYDLHGSGSATLGRIFGSTKFDRGLALLLTCAQELLALAKSRPCEGVAPEPPHPIVGDSVGNFSVRFQFGMEERWTRAFRNLLENLKWLLEWKAADESQQHKRLYSRNM